jgi:hypothetical protein
MYDNSCYCAVDKNGNKSLPKRDSHHRYHVSGKLVVADRDWFKEVFNNSVKLLQAGGDAQKIIMTPLACYITGKCCKQEDHITNFSDSNYSSDLGAQLEALGGWVKALSFTKRVRNFKVVCPNSMLGIDLDSTADENRLTDYWETDPVHLTTFGYNSLADSILDMSVDVQFNRADERKKTVATKKKPVERRESRVMGDEAVATRTDSRGPWPRNRGQNRGSWQRPGFSTRGRGLPRGHGKWSCPFKPY